MGSLKVFECCAMAAETQGWASCNRAALVAAKNRADSRLTFQLRESGPKMPREGSGEDCRRFASNFSRSPADTNCGPGCAMAPIVSRRASVSAADKKIPARSTIPGWEAARTVHSGGHLVITYLIGTAAGNFRAVETISSRNRLAARRWLSRKTGRLWRPVART